MRRLVAATLLGAALLAGCGGSPHSPTASAANSSASTAASANVSTTAGSSTTTGASTTSGGSTGPAAGASSSLAFAQCMRANGVPNLPDPLPGRGLLFPANGVNPDAPAFRAAQAKCRKLLPGGGPPGPGTETHPSAATLAKLLRIAECMRRHGISDFPDPRTSVPSNPLPGAGGVITDFDGAILLFPATMNLQAPAYRKALTACGAPPLGLPH